jgi:hypothetical protein
MEEIDRQEIDDLLAETRNANGGESNPDIRQEQPPNIDDQVQHGEEDAHPTGVSVRNTSMKTQMNSQDLQAKDKSLQDIIPKQDWHKWISQNW